MFLSRLWMVTALRHFQPQVSTAHNARMALHFGGCFRRDLLMKRPHNFIDAQNAATLGVTMPNRKKHIRKERKTHTHTHTCCGQTGISTLCKLNLVFTKEYSHLF